MSGSGFCFSRRVYFSEEEGERDNEEGITFAAETPTPPLLLRTEK
jgi:hypothetical protein